MNSGSFYLSLSVKLLNHIVFLFINLNPILNVSHVFGYFQFWVRSHCSRSPHSRLFGATEDTTPTPAFTPSGEGTK